MFIEVRSDIVLPMTSFDKGWATGYPPMPCVLCNKSKVQRRERQGEKGKRWVPETRVPGSRNINDIQPRGPLQRFHRETILDRTYYKAAIFTALYI